jgi:hypothetical protein
MNVFWMWLIGFYFLKFLKSKCFYYMNPFVSPLQIDLFWHNMCSFSNVLNENINIKFHQMNFWFEFLDIHMNEQTTFCHDCHCHGFKWENVN